MIEHISGDEVIHGSAGTSLTVLSVYELDGRIETMQ
jgi:uncharacterized small protein (DUF1192 family)